MIGIAAGDSVRVFRAAAAITDSTLVGRRFAPSLRALWRERQTGNVDSLIASEDSAITKGGDFTTITALHRLAIGRALTRAGDPSSSGVTVTNDEPGQSSTKSFTPRNKSSLGNSPV